MNEKTLMAPTRKALVALTDLIELLRTEIDPEMPVQQLQVFLQVALRGTTTQHELGENIGLSKASMSRNVSALGPINRFHQKGHDLLISREDPQYRRQKLIELSPKGRKLVNKLEALILKRCD